jgi:hypothetical protein
MKYFFSSCLEGMWKTMRKLCQDTHAPGPDLNLGNEFCPLTCDFWCLGIDALFRQEKSFIVVVFLHL